MLGLKRTQTKSALPPADGRRARRHFSLSGRQAFEGFLFITPWLIGVAAFVAFPLIQSFYYSFLEIKLQGVGLKTTYIGLANYREALLVDIQFLPYLKDAAMDLLIQLPVVLTFSLIIAILLNRKVPGTGIFRAIYFLPVVFASGIVLRQLFNQNAAVLPILEQIDLMSFLGPLVGWDTAQALMTLISAVIRTLWGAGVQILIFLAGLQGIAPSLYEAAEVDGATPWEMFWKITLPTLSPILLLNVIYTIVDSFTDVFNPVLSYVRTVGFRDQFRLGYAAAMGWLYFLLIFLVIVAVLRASRKHVHYSGER